MREYPMPPLRGTGFTDMMAEAARKLGWHAFPGPAAVNTRSYQNRGGCVYHGFCSRGGCHINAKGSTAVTTIPKAQATKRLAVVHRGPRHDDRGRRRRPRQRRDVSQGRHRILPACRRGAAGGLRRTKTCGCCSCRSRRRFPMGSPTTDGQVGRHYFSHNTGAGRDGALSAASEQLVWPAGAGRRRRQLGRRQLRSRGPRLHRRRQSLGVLRPATDRCGQHEHVRPRAAVGLGVEGLHQGERRPLEHGVSSEDDAAV